MNICRIGSKFWLKIHSSEFFTKFTAQLLTFEKIGSRRRICIDQQKAEWEKFKKFIMIGDDIESIATKRTRRGRWGDWVYGYEVDTKRQVRRHSMGTKRTRSGSLESLRQTKHDRAHRMWQRGPLSLLCSTAEIHYSTASLLDVRQRIQTVTLCNRSSANESAEDSAETHPFLNPAKRRTQGTLCPDISIDK